MTDDTLHPPHPRDNSDLLGHDAAEEKIIDAWRSGRFPHAWLISGPRGIGKATLAYRAARWILAGGDSGGGLFGAPPADLSMSPDSGVFRRISAGGHTDFRAIEREEGKTAIPVELIRQIVHFIHQTPAESDWKCILIDSADELNPSGANAILKVLEEPPQNTVFLIVGHAPGRLLPTIRSRCRKLSLSRLPDDVVVELLSRFKPDVKATDARILASLSDGSIGAALEFAEAGGVELLRAAMVLLAAPRLPGSEQLYGLADTLSTRGAEHSFDAFRTLLDWWMKRALKAQALGTTPTSLIPEDAAAFSAWQGLGGLETCMELWEKLTGLLAQSDNPANLDKRQLIVSAFLKIQRVAARAG